MVDSIVVRFASKFNKTFYLSGYDGGLTNIAFALLAVGSRLAPRESSDGSFYWDIAVVPHSDVDFAGMFYIGRTSVSRDFTCYVANKDGVPTGVIGRYRGAGIMPDALDEQFASVRPLFYDGGGILIRQFLLERYPFSAADERLRSIVEGVEFAGEIFFRKYSLPKMVLGVVVRADDGSYARSVHGWCEAGEGNCVPNEQTQIPIASITKAFTGHLLAKLIGSPDGLDSKINDSSEISFRNLVTHTSGLPRETNGLLKYVGGGELTREILSKSLQNHIIKEFSFPEANAASPYKVVFKPIVNHAAEIKQFNSERTALPDVLFKPGSGINYSNDGFNLLAEEIFNKYREEHDNNYYDLLKREVLAPLNLTNTSFEALTKLGANDLAENYFGGHDFDGAPWSHEVDCTPRGASGLYSTPQDILTWLEWHLDKTPDAVRELNHTIQYTREVLSPVIGMDEGGRMDGIALTWVGMELVDGEAFILQKTGGTNGVFSYVAFSPKAGIGFFMSIDQFEVAAALDMSVMINELILSLAPSLKKR